MSKAIIKAKGEEIEVSDVDVTNLAIPDKIQTDEVVEKALASQGLVKVSATSLRDLKTLGIHLNALGMLRTTQGAIFANRTRMETVLQVLVERAANGKGKRMSVKSIALLARNIALMGGKITESQKLMMESSGVRFGKASPSEGGDAPKNRSFPPGTFIQINNPAPTEVKINGEKVVAPKAAPS